MRSKRIHAALVIVFTFLAAVAMAQGQSKELAHGADAAALAVSGPPEQLKKADFMVGQWNVASKMRPSPGAEWQESNATAETKRALNDCVFRTTVAGSMAGVEFEAEEILTYNRDAKRWESYRFDTRLSRATVFKGGFDGGGNLLLNTEETLGGKTAMLRNIVIPKSEDEFHWKMEVSYDKGLNWVETGKTVYTRK